MTSPKGTTRLVFALLGVGGFLFGVPGANGQAQQGAATNKGGAPASAATRADGVNPESGFRLPLLQRDQLDDEGKRVYDEISSPENRGFVGWHGPSGILIYNPRLAKLNRDLNQYLRFESGLSGITREIAILVTAREADSQFEWTAHEPLALRAGVDPKIIDIIKYRKSAEGLPEKEAAIIELGRELWQQKKVAPETFDHALRLFGARDLVNIVALMGQYSMTAALLTTFDNQLLPGQKPLLPIP